jgi:hypothetical protein
MDPPEISNPTLSALRRNSELPVEPESGELQSKFMGVAGECSPMASFVSGGSETCTLPFGNPAPKAC